jgi:hypothetical protein
MIFGHFWNARIFWRRFSFQRISNDIVGSRWVKIPNKHGGYKGTTISRICCTCKIVWLFDTTEVVYNLGNAIWIKFYTLETQSSNETQKQNTITPSHISGHRLITSMILKSLNLKLFDLPYPPTFMKNDQYWREIDCFEQVVRFKADDSFSCCN